MATPPQPTPQLVRVDPHSVVLCTLALETFCTTSHSDPPAHPHPQPAAIGTGANGILPGGPSTSRAASLALSALDSAVNRAAAPSTGGNGKPPGGAIADVDLVAVSLGGPLDQSGAATATGGSGGPLGAPALANGKALGVNGLQGGTTGVSAEATGGSGDLVGGPSLATSLSTGEAWRDYVDVNGCPFTASRRLIRRQAD